ncbi:ankyrin repeat domain-containing protein [Arthrobacter polaris]|uniref:ankyrin repeat domain-containing protein n=1 Tax=Arthrobacter polaris TaxID=2813727 RepID=UPI002AFEA5F2|nr:ankyrin repeat domain-containing protein [Arthrobacter polaris]
MTNDSSLNEDQTAKVTALAMDLAREDKTAELAEFLDHGLALDVQDPEGNTLLMLAAYKGQSGTVSMLLERGANANIRNSRDQSPRWRTLQGRRRRGGTLSGRRSRSRRRNTLSPRHGRHVWP